MVEIRILLPSMKIERAKRAREPAEGLGGVGRCKLPPMGSGTMF